MKNEISRRNFLRLSGAVVAVAALSGALTGCGSDEKPVAVQPFNKELTAGKCKVTFLTVGGSGSATTQAAVIVQQVTLKVENLGSDTVTLKTTDFTVMTNEGQKLEVGSCRNAADSSITAAGEVSVAPGKEAEISLGLKQESQIDTDKVQTITASVTINGATVSAIETKANFKWWLG